MISNDLSSKNSSIYRIMTEQFLFIKIIYQFIIFYTCNISIVTFNLREIIVYNEENVYK